MRRISFDPVAKIFDKTRGMPKRVNKQLFEALVNELTNYRTILDAGIGTGRFAKPLQDNGFEVIGIDLSQKMLSVAKEKSVTNLFRGDICFLPFKDDSFDAALCNSVLHLIPKWKAALQEICRVTSKVMVSTIREHRNPVREAYNRLLEKYRYENRRRGKSEYYLKDLVAPSRSIRVASYYVDAKENLAHMSQRAYSSQWNIPESVNKEIVGALRSRFSSKKYLQELRIIVWNLDDLRAYLRQGRR